MIKEVMTNDAKFWRVMFFGFLIIWIWCNVMLIRALKVRDRLCEHPCISAVLEKDVLEELGCPEK